MSKSSVVSLHKLWHSPFQNFLFLYRQAGGLSLTYASNKIQSHLQGMAITLSARSATPTELQKAMGVELARLVELCQGSGAVPQGPARLCTMEH